MKITLAHSPDADDAFMFYAMAHDLIDMKGYTFEHHLCDIHTLTDHAIHHQTYDVTAISYYGLTKCDRHYDLMPVGSSMGDNYGPILICAKDNPRSDAEIIAGIRSGDITVAIPGDLTSTYLTFCMWAGQSAAHQSVYFQEIEDRIESGEYVTGIVIHEGQITLDTSRFRIIADLGQWWHDTEGGLLLPLGCNVIRNTIPAEKQKEIAEILRESIEYSLNHMEEATNYAMEYGRGIENIDAKKFIGMYVNKYTLDLGEHGYQSIRRFYDKAMASELIDHIPNI